MKKLLVWAMVLVVALLPVCASAATVVSQGTVENYVYLGTASNTYVTQVEDGYQIYNANGEPVGPVWPQMGPMMNGLYYKVLYDGKLGVVNAEGEFVLLDNYFGFVTVGEEVLVGVMMENTTAPNPDYTSNAGQAMNVVRADVIRDGVLIGSLTREHYLPTAKVGVIGGYIYIYHADGRCLWFDRALNQTAETKGEPEEFTATNGAYIHTPTQQVAFVPECTLKNEDVEQAAAVFGNNILDLQGNVIATMESTDRITVRVTGNFCYVEQNGKMGVWNLQGKSIIPMEYIYIGDSYSQYTEYFPSGYQTAIHPAGKLDFYHESGEVTASIDRPMRASSNPGLLQNAPFVAAANSDNSYTIYSATCGELAETYSDLQLYYEGQKLMSVERMGLWTCIDLDGNELLPCDLADYPDVSDDGTLVIGERYDGTVIRYMINYGE